MPLALLLLILVGGGATGVVAEKSLPGDVLYPVKIHINENLESAIALTAKSDAEVSVRQAARRLAEAEQLKEKGKLSSEQSIELKDAFNAEVKLVKENVAKVRSKGDSKSADEIDTKLEENIKEHSDITVVLGVRDDEVEENSVTKEESRVKSQENSIRNDADDEGDDEEDEDDDKKVITPVRVTPKVVTPPKTTTPTTPVSTVKKYTMEQVATHSTPTDCWSAVNGGVYNLTGWITEHPGGQFPIISMCGKDGTTMFLNAHGGQGDPARELATLKIGELQ